jgi:ABC-type Fe3+-hydroxamate transport system substrate-binding protein
MCGARNAVRDSGWVQLSLEDVVRLAPDAIVLVKPGASVDEVRSDLGPLATIDVPAVQQGQLAVLAHPDALLPSSAVVGVVADLRGILQRFATTARDRDNRP